MKNPPSTIDHLEVGKLEKNFDLGKVGKGIGHFLALVYA
jgi:hypothetical protein